LNLFYNKKFTLEENILLRRIPEIQNYCNRWCQRCPLAHRCGVYQVINSDSEDISVLAEGTESSEVESENPFANLDLDSNEALQKVKKEQEKRAPLNLQKHALMQSFHQWDEYYQKLLLYLETSLLKEYLAKPILRKQKEQEIDNAFSALDRYKDFIGPKLSRALGGKHDFVQGLELLQSDWNGTAKISLLVLNDICLATEKLLQYMGDSEQMLIRFWQLSQNLRDEMRHEFPYAQSFIRPGFDTLGLRHNLGLE
jgi:hypothetical protein